MQGRPGTAVTAFRGDALEKRHVAFAAVAVPALEQQHGQLARRVLWRRRSGGDGKARWEAALGATASSVTGMRLARALGAHTAKVVLVPGTGVSVW